MAKNFSVTFSILGNIDPSLLKALQTAADRVKNLSELSRRVNARAVNQQKALSNAQGLMNQIREYRSLQQALQSNQAARAREILTGNRLVSQKTTEEKKLSEMTRGYKELEKRRAALKGDKEARQLELRLTKQEMQAARLQVKASKQAGDVAGLRAAQAQVESLTQALNRQRAAAQSAGAALKDINSSMKVGKSELAAQKSVVQNLSGQISQSSTRAAQLQQTLLSQQSQLSQLRTRIPSGNVAAAEAALQSQINRTTEALNREIAAIAQRNRLLNDFHNSSQRLDNSYNNFQNARGTAQSLLSPFASATKNAMDFEFAMSKVKALTQMRNIRAGNFTRAEEETKALEEQAKHLGATTEFTQTEIANAMGFYGMAGWDTSRIQAIMDGTLALASIAGDHNIARTAEVLSDDLSALGMKAGRQMRLSSGKIVEESAYFIDAFAYAITQANLSRESLHEALKYNAPTAHASGLSLGETFAMNMISANAGIKGSQAGTSFRQGWVRFLAPPKTAVKALQEMGKEMGVVVSQSDALKESMESAATLKSIGVDENSDLFTKITKAYEHYQTLDENQRSGWLKGLVGQTALSAWQTVFDAGNIEQIARIAQEIDSGAIEGWAKDTAAVMRNNTLTEWELLKSSIDACAQSVGATFLPAVRSAMAMTASMAGGLNEWIQQHQTAVQWLGLLAAAVSAVIVACAGLSLLASAFSFISAGAALAAGAVSVLAAGFAALWTAGLAPILATVAAIAAFIAIVTVAINHAEQIKQALSDAWNHPKGAVTGFCELLKSSIGPAVQYVIDRWNTLKSALSHPLEAVINFFDHGSVVGGNVQGYDNGKAIENPLPAQPLLETGAAFQQMSPSVTETGAAFQQMSPSVTETGAAFQQMSPSVTETGAAFQQMSPSVTETGAAFQQMSPSVTETGAAFQQMSPSVTETGAAFQQMSPSVTETGAAFQQMSPSVTETGAAFQQMSPTAQMSTEGLNNVGMASATTSPEISNVGMTSATASGNLQAMGGVAVGAAVNIAQLSGAASAIASALAAKAAEISSIVINVPQVNLIPVNVPVNSVHRHNARGGIYPKGAFTTWFAEDSPEAAIPLDGSARAVSLWHQAGHLLGIDPQPLQHNFSFSPAGPVTFNVNVTVNGNADQNVVRQGVEQALPPLLSFAEQFAAFQHEQARCSFI